MRITEKFSNIAIVLSRFGLEKHSGGYFCTPKNAVTFAGIGVDGIHFCILPDENDLTLENSPVYVISPMMPDHYVEIVAENFYDFISLVITAKDAGALECISYFTSEKYLEYLQSISDSLLQNTEFNNKVKKATTALLDEFNNNKKIDDVYGYVKQLQAKTDLTKIQYTNEYYDLIG